MIIEKEVCKRRGKHQTRIFQSAFPSKKFCYYCMEEVKKEQETK